MTSKIISGVLILITVYLNVKHGWEGVMNKMNPEETKMLADLGIGSTMTKVIGILSLAVAIMTLIPQTFFAGNLLNAGLILCIMALALKTDNIKTALIEIPFLTMPLVMIYLGHPFSTK
jgi:hypothetical protein